MIIYKCHEIQHEADLGMGLRFIRKHRRYYLHHYAIRDNFDDVIKFNPEGGVVLAYAGRRGISQEVRDHITKLFRSWNSAVEPDWDSYQTGVRKVARKNECIPPGHAQSHGHVRLQGPNRRERMALG